MKRILSLILVISCVLSVPVFASEYKIVDKTIKIQDENKVVREIPTGYSYDKTYFLAENIDGVITCKYTNTYSNGWQSCSLEDYIKNYDERNSLGITY